ncbi:hypothetical protein BT96DRAFT_981216 [Gymnopus androsaceus JB14]|uniref:Uncharacterized protein n=1 Tax=Gymnopus androsaceus JB14 TaxID=1447944 RepID=A0A6A4GQD6_9AGAR|nr:hypothetical protein BT96DRAFT_981216 [Gymnopus androsaceus JB14]
MANSKLSSLLGPNEKNSSFKPRIESQAIDAQAQKKRLYDYKTQLSSLLSPIRHIPNEILCLIFEFACTENFLQEYPWPSNLVVRPTEVASPVMTYLPALAISAVCKRWRDLGLVSNHLWSRLKLEILHVEENSELAETAPDMHASDTHGGFISTLQLYLSWTARVMLRFSSTFK